MTTNHALAMLVALGATLAPLAARSQPATAAATAPLRVEQFTVPGPGSVNSWWIDAPGGLIVIDFQRDTAAAAAAIARIRATGRPVAALLLTHPHPDHIGGIAQFKAAFPRAPLYASRASAREIESDSRGYQKMTGETLKQRAPKSFPAPDRIVENGRALTIAGLRVEPRELGVGESVAMTVYHIPAPAALFSGDVAVAGMTDFLMEGRTAQWLGQIETLRRDYPSVKTLYPGHGRSGAPAPILSEATRMLRTYREEIARVIARRPGGAAELAPAEVAAAAKTIRAKLGSGPPVAEVPDLLGENVKAVGVELLADRRPR